MSKRESLSRWLRTTEQEKRALSDRRVVSGLARTGQVSRSTVMLAEEDVAIEDALGSGVDAEANNEMTDENLDLSDDATDAIGESQDDSDGFAEDEFEDRADDSEELIVLYQELEAAEKHLEEVRVELASKLGDMDTDLTDVSGRLNTVRDRANEAFGKAETADSKATTADGKASSAQTAANAATSAATTANQKALEALGLASTGKVWVQDTAPPKGKWYGWVAARHASASVYMDGSSETRRNLNPNPSFEASNLAGYGTSVASMALTTDWANHGRQSVRVTTNTLGNAGDIRVGGTSPGSFPPGVEPGKTYTIQATCRTVSKHSGFVHSTGSRQRRVLVFISSPSAVTAPFFGPQADNVVGVYEVSHTVAIPSDATSVLFAIGCAGSGSDPNFVTEVDDWMWEEAPDKRPYFDGDTPGDRATDLWINTTSGSNAPNRFVNGSWVEVTDKVAKDAAAAAASAAQAAQNAQQKADQADTKAGNAQSAAQSAQSTADTAKSTADTARQEATSKAAAAEVAAKSHADAQAEAARLAAVATASGDASDKAAAAEAAAKAAASLDASQKADAAREAAELKAAEAKAAADAAQSRADEAHSLAGSAQSNAQAALTMAGTKSRVFYSTDAPSGTGTATGDLWRQRDSSQNIIAEWYWSGTGWVETKVSSSAISNLDVGKLTVGTGVISDLVAQNIAARAGQFIELDVGQLNVTGTTQIRQAVIEYLFANVVKAKLLTVTEKIITQDIIADGAILARMLSAGSIDGMTITGALIRTAASGQRLQIDINGLRTFSSTGAETARLTAASGGLMLTGNLVNDDSTSGMRTTLGNGRLNFSASGMAVQYVTMDMTGIRSQASNVPLRISQSAAGNDSNIELDAGANNQIRMLSRVRSLGDTDWVTLLLPPGIVPHAGAAPRMRIRAGKLIVKGAVARSSGSFGTSFVIVIQPGEVPQLPGVSGWYAVRPAMSASGLPPGRQNIQDDGSIQVAAASGAPTYFILDAEYEIEW